LISMSVFNASTAFSFNIFFGCLILLILFYRLLWHSTDALTYFECNCLTVKKKQ
jgi:hypothetical protein